ncbi:sporulation-specific diadenylate cyclase CdaS [Paenibacillus sp. GCM10027628]|uniref:sporulation-specific diadenylate cyclase CdaS n=1 Tax=Paenibacillus sp. GCM10027628 TaxID=3273413 RepID=UPI003634F020
MQSDVCDESPMKEQIKEQLRQISDRIQDSLHSMDNEDCCLLSNFDRIRESFQQMESMSASFYLQCYLSPFTSKFSDISTTIQYLAKRRYGALIVIQRDQALENFMHSGIPLEAALTYSLLESIFYPGNPLHDGAVLIQSDRIVSAANILPVSQTTVSRKKIGTRHRAAIGLTENTDALVLVVSEETGSTSFAYQGQLHPIYDLFQESKRN